MTEQYVLIQECGGSFRFFGSKDECVAYAAQEYRENPSWCDLLLCPDENSRAVSWVAQDWHYALPVRIRDSLCKTLISAGYTDVRAVIVSRKYLFLGTKDGKQTGFTFDKRRHCLVSK